MFFRNWVSFHFEYKGTELLILYCWIYKIQLVLIKSLPPILHLPKHHELSLIVFPLPTLSPFFPIDNLANLQKSFVLCWGFNQPSSLHLLQKKMGTCKLISEELIGNFDTWGIYYGFVADILCLLLVNFLFFLQFSHSLISALHDIRYQGWQVLTMPSWANWCIHVQYVPLWSISNAPLDQVKELLFSLLFLEVSSNKLISKESSTH